MCLNLKMFITDILINHLSKWSSNQHYFHSHIKISSSFWRVNKHQTHRQQSGFDVHH